MRCGMLGDAEALRRLWGGPLHDLVTKLNGEKGSEWEKALKRFLRRENPWETKILPINRDQPFDPLQFLDRGWSIVEEDQRSLSLGEIDLSQIQLVTMLRKGETVIKGKEKLRRIKEAGYVRLDAKVLQTLWENQEFIPESWKKKFVYFDGTIFQISGFHCVLYFRWHGGHWHWCYSCLGDDWSSSGPSAVLAS